VKVKKYFCVRVCVRKTFQNVLNKTKLEKIWKMKTPLNKGVSVFMRVLGNSEVFTRNEQVYGSNPYIGSTLIPYE